VTARRKRNLASYRLEHGLHLVEIRLREPRQLFNSLDPAPFHEKDLDASAEEYIVGAMRELGTRHSKLVLYLPAAIVNTPDAQSIPDAIHTYFSYRAQHAGAELGQTLRFGAVSLLIGLCFLFLCLSLRELVGLLDLDASEQILMEGLLIVGWVALWRPLEIFLYEWWPIRQRQKLFTRIAHLAIEIRSEQQ
jgi:hypothetical protein